MAAPSPACAYVCELQSSCIYCMYNDVFIRIRTDIPPNMPCAYHMPICVLDHDVRVSQCDSDKIDINRFNLK
jgi:hypothetical protein